MEKIIKDINDICDKLNIHSEDYVISEINDYINNIKDIDKLELINKLKENNKLSMNIERNKYILDYVKNLIKNKITCYNKYVKLTLKSEDKIPLNYYTLISSNYLIDTQYIYDIFRCNKQSPFSKIISKIIKSPQKFYEI